MKHKSFALKFVSLVTFMLVASISGVVIAQEEREAQGERPLFSGEKSDVAKQARQAMGPSQTQLGCRGPITQVLDLADENTRFTPANFFTMPGGGQGGGFDKTPLLSTKVTLKSGCLNAHLSAIVGSRLYGVAGLTMIQVTLTPASGIGGPRHMVGHFEHPFGSNSPAVATEAERDVDMFAANFFQKVGSGPHEVPPGLYRVDVWWSGAGAGGAIAFTAVLKLYQ